MASHFHEADYGQIPVVHQDLGSGLFEQNASKAADPSRGMQMMDRPHQIRSVQIPRCLSRA